jgi:hypothetical protein
MSAVAQDHDIQAPPVKPGAQNSVPAAQPRQAPRPAPPADQGRGYLGDWVVLQLWIICFAVTGVVCLAQWGAGFWRQ